MDTKWPLRVRTIFFPCVTTSAPSSGLYFNVQGGCVTTSAPSSGLYFNAQGEHYPQGREKTMHERATSTDTERVNLSLKRYMKPNGSDNQLASSSSVAIVGEGQLQIRSSEEEFLTIPGAVVHLIDGQESVHLATGNFSLVRLKQDGDIIAVFAKVGEGLRWPLAKDELTGKLDSRHYFFSFKVPEEVEDVSEEEAGERGPLNYGVTFASEGQDLQLEDLDRYLQQYSYFSAPSVVQGEPEKDEEVPQQESAGLDEVSKKHKSRWDLLAEYVFGKAKPALAKPATIPDSTIPAKIGPSDDASSEKQQLVEETSAAYWTILAPNVEDYSSSLAKGIAVGSGHIIKGIFWCSDTTIAQLEKGGLYMRDRLKRNSKPSQISPRTMKNIRRVKRMSKMTEKVARGVLTGIVTTTGIVSASVIKSKAGKKFFKLLPGEVALVSLDAFGKVFDAVELAGKNVLTSTNTVTCGVVSHRYGEEAAEATKETLSTAGHVFSTAWTVSKIRKVLNPKSGGKTSKTGIVKTAGKAALRSRQT